MRMPDRITGVNWILVSLGFLTVGYALSTILNSQAAYTQGFEATRSLIEKQVARQPKFGQPLLPQVGRDNLNQAAHSSASIEKTPQADSATPGETKLIRPGPGSGTVNYSDRLRAEPNYRDNAVPLFQAPTQLNPSTIPLGLGEDF